MLFALVAMVFAMSAIAADPPVKVAIAVTGDAVPGATVQAKATVTINDGSALQSISWKQDGGAPVTLSGNQTDTVTITLPDRNAFRERLIEILEEPPIPAASFPIHVPVPNPYAGGLQERFTVVGVSPLAIEEAGAINFDITVVTSSGTYHNSAAVAAKLPFATAIGQRNVPILIPVVLHAPKQAAYNWTLTAPSGSTATLTGATTQNPEFTPDVAGMYTVTITNLTTNSAVSIPIGAGTWKGMITGTKADNTAIPDPACLTCHVNKADKFTPWSQSGHSHVFTQNVNTPGGHYAASCIGCHSVGYNDPGIKNGGIDDAEDFPAFMASGLLTHADPLNWGKIVTQFPKTARFANIQCENCHGPQDSVAHTQRGMRQNLSSDMCGTCHGEPARHGRYQQWQLSRHANYELAGEEGTNATCAKCHSGNGFLAWQATNFSDASLQITWTAEEVHPVTCAVCHDPHDVGTSSGGPTTDAKVRVTNTTPMLMAGFSATDVGGGAICMTCHNGRRGLRDDAHFTVSDAARAPHQGPQADILMGQNLYFAKVGNRGFHSMVADTCVACHMESTPPPPTLSSSGGGTNHTFFASKTICSKCHTEITAESIQGQVETKLETLKAAIEKAILITMQTQIRAGNAIDIGGTVVKNAADLKSVEFVESHGSQAVTVTLANNTKIADIALTAVKVVRPAGSSVALYAVADPAIPKAGWNLMMVEADKSLGVHNPAFVNSGLDVATFAMNVIATGATAPVPGGGTNNGIGGGLGNGAGAVSCATPYVYWAEIVSHSAGLAGSQWRTDLIARNLGGANASLKFFLHQVNAANLEGTGTVQANGQKAFEDVVALLGGTNNLGSLEICSDQPLLVMGRIFNLGTAGTFGQNLDGRVADLGYTAGQTISLIGLRQKTDAFRSNISVTNAGKTEAQVTINLFDATGAALKSYDLIIPAGTVLQDTEPFKNRAGAPDVDWGFATVTVLKGSNILTSASMIDMKTNDPTTIQPKQ
ncbi:MAG TPA: hypothetical protein VLV78_17920 [Thermoanaerobaculia bacterium]|nr:hypothetical protein [Thermoanaerobaculia bacterium]